MDSSLHKNSTTNSIKIAFKWLAAENTLRTLPTLVFLHDALGSIGQWKDFPDLLVKSTGCQGLIYDRLGYGDSSPNTEPRTKDYLHHEALVALPALLDKLKLNDVILIGHSDGGSISLIFAGSCPKHIRLRGIITEAAHIFVDHLTIQGIQEAVIASQNNSFLEKLSKFHGDKTISVFEGWHKTWLKEDFRNWNISNYLSTITCPSLIIQGKNDEYGTPEQVETICRLVNGPSKALMIPDCAHIPHFQSQEIVLKEMTQFIKNLI